MVFAICFVLVIVFWPKPSSIITYDLKNYKVIQDESNDYVWIEKKGTKPTKTLIWLQLHHSFLLSGHDKYIIEKTVLPIINLVPKDTRIMLPIGQTSRNKKDLIKVEISKSDSTVIDKY